MWNQSQTHLQTAGEKIKLSTNEARHLTRYICVAKAFHLVDQNSSARDVFRLASIEEDRSRSSPGLRALPFFCGNHTWQLELFHVRECHPRLTLPGQPHISQLLASSSLYFQVVCHLSEKERYTMLSNCLLHGFLPDSNDRWRQQFHPQMPRSLSLQGEVHFPMETKWTQTGYEGLRCKNCKDLAIHFWHGPTCFTYNCRIGIIELECNPRLVYGLPFCLRNRHYRVTSILYDYHIDDRIGRVGPRDPRFIADPVCSVGTQAGLMSHPLLRFSLTLTEFQPSHPTSNVKFYPPELCPTLAQSPRPLLLHNYAVRVLTRETYTATTSHASPLYR